MTLPIEFPADISFPNDIKRRKVAVGYIEAVRSNPNGDPDSNGPRVDLEGYGIISPQAIKRKVRDYIATTYVDESHYVARGADLGAQQAAVGTTQEATKRYRDLRWFGGILTQFKDSAARVRGPLVVRGARSLQPVQIVESTLTRVAHHGKENKDGGVDVTANMGRVTYVERAVYRFTVAYDPSGATAVQLTPQDLDLFWEGLVCGWETSRSTLRPEVNLRFLAVMEFPNARGNLPGHLVERLVQHNTDVDPLAPFEDYDVQVLPMPAGKGITCTVWRA